MKTYTQAEVDKLVAGAYEQAAKAAEEYPEAESYVCQDIASSIRALRSSAKPAEASQKDAK